MRAMVALVAFSWFGEQATRIGRIFMNYYTMIDSEVPYLETSGRHARAVCTSRLIVCIVVLELTPIRLLSCIGIQQGLAVFLVPR